MDFDLKEVGATIILGAYLLFGLEVVSYLLFGSNAYLQIEKSTRFTSRGLLGLSVALCFAFGMLMEDVSDKFVDRETTMQKAVRAILPFAKTDDDLKIATLYGEEKRGKEEKLDRLAQEMATRHLFCNYGGSNGRIVESAISQKKSLKSVSKEVKEEAAKQLYYHAKNTVYREDNYYDELKRIQLRIDFSRSFLAISALLIVLTLMLATYRGLRLLRSVLRRRRGLRDDQLRAKVSKLLARTASIACVLFLFCVLAAFSYQAEERQFNARAYGYFSSLHTAKDAAVEHSIEVMPGMEQPLRPCPPLKPASAPSPSAAPLPAR